MQAVDKNLLQFMEGADKHFIIPVYQRNYDWKKEHCKKLFEDIIRIIEYRKPSYFIGSIVTATGESQDDYVLIDGQQRLTTVSLLLLAIYRLLSNGKIISANSNLCNQIRDEYLINKYAPDEKKIRLKPTKNDNKIFESLFDPKVEDTILSGTKIFDNYNYFIQLVSSLKETGISLDEFFLAIKSLRIVHIWLNSEDSPQLIFESLNSTGKQLEESDLIRNYILMNKLPNEQERIYEAFWHPIEKNTDHRVGEFIRDYLTYKTGYTPRKDMVYQEFKLFVEKSNSKSTLDNLLSELLIFSKFYHQFLFYDSSDELINLGLKRIDRLQVTVVYPYLMDLFNAWMEEKIISSEEVRNVIEVIESFIVRRIICNVATNALNKVFASLGRNIRKTDGYEQNYIDRFSYFISAGMSSNRFPNDEEFSNELLKRDVYNLKAKNKIHLYERIENFDNREKVDVEALFERKEEGLTFEHIMPQTLKSDWKKDLGQDYALIHEQYLHTIGNVTLTAYNSGLSNSSFTDKVNMKNGFKQSRLWLNKFISSQSIWGEAQIRERATILIERAKSIWKFPKSNFIPSQKSDIRYALFDDFIFSGKKPLAFSFLGKDYKVKTWRELYLGTLRMLYELDTDTFNRAVSDIKRKGHFSESEDVFRIKEKLNNHYINVNLSAYQIIQNIRGLFKAFELDEDDYEIIISSEDQEKSDNNASLTLEDLGL